ncbi:GNAT family N-acetyltransferase [Streptomyces sp. SID1121]|uniref:GNAT family N-acetyltransferase n=1 Tax=Streptomyces sp. SID1121 TaxID=3425888 RepID=UPI004057B6A0
MTLARPATPADAEELVRLRTVMLDSLAGPSTDLGWQPAAVETLRRKLADPSGDLTAFVVDRPDAPATSDTPHAPGALAATAVGVIEHRLGGPANPTGISGYVFSVATDPDLRRLGYSRACVEALLDWFRARGVRKIDLRASREGEPLYASLGFVRTPDPAMRLTL